MFRSRVAIRVVRDQKHLLISARTPAYRTRMSYAAPYAESEELVELVRDKSKIAGKDYAIVDVRDKDFIGGNIPGAINVPAGQMVDQGNALISKLSGVPRVYFHCALSQQRGPKAARIYNEMRHLTGVREPQEVKVLRGGFEGWHAKYRKEPDLIENYDKSIWGIYDELEAEEEQDNPDFPGIPKH